jgi:PAS domain S-box-containing protein
MLALPVLASDMKKQTSLLKHTSFLFVLLMTLLVLLGVGLYLTFSHSFRIDISRRNLSLADVTAHELHMVQHELESDMYELARLLDAEETQDPARTESLLKAIFDFSRLCEVAHILNTKGIIQYSYPPNRDLDNLDMSNQAYFKKAVGKKNICWSESFISPYTGESTITTALGLNRGVLVCQVSLRKLCEFVQTMSVGENGFIAICDQHGVAISHSETSYPLESVNLKSLEAVRKGLTGKRGTYLETWNGNHGLASVSLIPETDWVIVIFQLRDDALGLFYTTRIIAIVILLTALVLVFLFFFITLRRFLAPLHRLKIQAGQIARGQYGTTVSSRFTEFTALSNSFNEMSSAIRNREAALKVSRENLAEAQKIAGVGNFRIDLESNVITCSEECCRLFELNCTDCPIRYKDFISLIHPDDRQNVVLTLDTVRMDGTPYDVEYRLILENGMERYIHARGMPVFNNKGNVVQINNVVQDISEQKRGERERRKLQSQLVQAQKLEAIGTLAGGIAHDFNNILFAIFGYTELTLSGKATGEELRANLEQVLLAARRARDLVQQILAFSRQTEKAFKPLKFSLVIKEVLKMIRATLPATITIQQEIKSNGLVLGDPTQLHQVLVNLCTNAAHAMNDYGGVITVRLDECVLNEPSVNLISKLPPGKYLRLVVSDSGKGMDEKIRQRIFDPFFTTKTDGEGTGLGLSVVLGIVQNHHGSISVYSEPGVGTTFNIYIPAAKSEEIRETPASAEIPEGNERILLIDDEIPLTKVVKRMLDSLGYSVIISNSSLSALAEFSKVPDQFNLVITDMTMPYMTGEDLAVKIKDIRSDIPIILLTGFNPRANDGHLKDKGIDAVMMKPLTKLEIAMTVRNVLDKSNEM